MTRGHWRAVLVGCALGALATLVCHGGVLGTLVAPATGALWGWLVLEVREAARERERWGTQR